MSVTLSKSAITSFCGDILPLHLGFDGEDHNRLSRADITWKVDSNCVAIRSFSGDTEGCFNNGVLLILKKPGNATVTAKLDGEEYVCTVTVREPAHVSSDDKLEFFIGDLHNHTTKIHDHNAFIMRTSQFQHEFIDQVKAEGRLDFCAMSDHAAILNDTEFFRNFLEVEKKEPSGVVIFPGAESEVTVLESDRFGVLHKNSGEIVTVCTDGYGDSTTWEHFYECVAHAPSPIAIFAHPHVVGFSTKGVWNFCFQKNNTPEMLRAIRGIETINGGELHQNLMHESCYSLALDYGFRVSPVASSDSHGPVWGYRRMEPKTVLLAPEKSREAFLDALRNNRFYATESGNLKLRYTVNGKAAPADLDAASKYRFHVTLSYFKEDESTVPTSCAVISNGGKTLLSLTDIPSTFDFEIHSETARYFYLRFVDRKGRRTWSMPVWTGRPFERYEAPDLTPIDLSSATAVDTLSGADASAAIDGDVYHTWEVPSGQASLVIDLGRVQTVSAIGNYPRIITRPLKSADPEAYARWREDHDSATIPTSFEVYTSVDGTTYEKQADGIFRMFGGENIVTFAPTNARFVRLDLLSTVGKDAFPRIYENANCSIGNLAVFA